MTFSAGNRVRISTEYHWAKGAIATVQKSIVNTSAPTGDVPYFAAALEETALTRL